MPETVRYGSVPFTEAIDYFRNKLNVPTERWNDIWRSGHNSGFMVAGALKDDLLNDFRKAVDSAIAEGKSLSWFKKEFNNIKQRHGWEHNGKANWRAKVIYDTNMRQSYNAGRYEQLQNFPFWEYQHGDSLSPRPMHLSWHGLILPKGDPWWQTHFPQNGWGCKCRVRGRTQAYLDRKGITLDAKPNNGVWEWTDKVTGEVHEIPKGIDPGFDYAPQKAEVAKRQKAIVVKKAKPFVPPPRIAPTAFSTTPGVDVHGLNKALNQLKTTSAAPQVERFGLFLAKHQSKTLFIKQKEMNPKAVAATKIVNEVESYLGKHPLYRTMQLYTDRGYLRAGGFTSSVFDHVVIKVAPGARLSKVDVNELKQSIQAALAMQAANKPVFTFSELLRVHGTNGADSAMLSTWLHEMGHQVHYKAGKPRQPTYKTITRYAQTNNYEWHAEMFVAWLLDRQALAKWDNDVAVYMDKLIEKALKDDK